MRTIPLSGAKAAGRVVLVDDEDYDLLSRHRWFVWEFKREGRRTNGPYAVTHIKQAGGGRRCLFMHKMITGYDRTDHEDHDGLNNQRSNLRPATRSQNGQNSRPNVRRGSSQYKGVYWFGGQREWRANIRSGGKQVYLGAFSNERDAALAYDAAARELHGRYAVLNLPDQAALSMAASSSRVIRRLQSLFMQRT